MGESCPGAPTVPCFSDNSWGVDSPLADATDFTRARISRWTRWFLQLGSDNRVLGNGVSPWKLDQALPTSQNRAYSARKSGKRSH